VGRRFWAVRDHYAVSANRIHNLTVDGALTIQHRPIVFEGLGGRFDTRGIGSMHTDVSVRMQVEGAVDGVQYLPVQAQRLDVSLGLIHFELPFEAY
jgi:hypothetical protein